MKTLPSDARLGATKNLRELPIVLARWIDSASMGRWRSFDSARKEAKGVECLSVGFLAVNNSKQVTLLQSVGYEGDCNDLITIPRGCIRSVTVIRQGKHKP